MTACQPDGGHATAPGMTTGTGATATTTATAAATASAARTPAETCRRAIKAAAAASARTTVIEAAPDDPDGHGRLPATFDVQRATIAIHDTAQPAGSATTAAAGGATRPITAAIRPSAVAGATAGSASRLASTPLTGTPPPMPTTSGATAAGRGADHDQRADRTGRPAPPRPVLEPRRRALGDDDQRRRRADRHRETD